MQWDKENVAKSIKKAKSKMNKFTANGYASWIKGKTDKYPVIKHIYEIFGSWNDMKREVFEDAEIYRENKWNGTKEEALEKLRETIPFVERVSYNKIKNYCDVFPSKNYIIDNFGSWTNMKRLAAGKSVGYNNKNEFCRVCGIPRCRFDNNLDECEYYEGE